MKYIVLRRTFEAKQHPVNSSKRIMLNMNNLTSENFTKYKYVIRRAEEPLKKLPLELFETKKEAKDVLEILEYRERIKHCITS